MARDHLSRAPTRKVTVKRNVAPSANKSARSATESNTSLRPLAKGAPGGYPKANQDPGPTKKAPGQGPGPTLVGMDNEVGSAVPSRILTTRVVRRASHTDATLRPGRLVDYSKSLGR